MRFFSSPAKINLYLRIVRRRPDGFHDIETLFQRIGLADRLGFDIREENGVELIYDERSKVRRELLPSDPQKNLITRAYNILEEHIGYPLPGVRVLQEKHMPIGGGLGGGSSNAATALHAFNEMFHLNLSRDTLSTLGAQLGSDVAFFLNAPTAIGQARGEFLTPVYHDCRFYIALAFPTLSVSTPAVYKQYDPQNPAKVAPIQPLLDALEQGNLQGTLNSLYNEMEALAFSLEPSLGELRIQLENKAKQPVRMSGSGSTLFTLTETKEQAAQIAASWRTAHLRTAVAPFLLES